MRLKEIKPGMVIHCKTEEERIVLINHLEEQGGFIWKGTRTSPSEFPWASPLLIIDGDCNITQGSRMDLHENITEFSDLIIPELSAKEVLETMADICKEYTLNGCGIKCPLMNNCLFEEVAEDIDKTIDICTKWREEHPKEEKKELETEWVYVVRIIKVHDNGKKECVHEVDYGRNEQKEFAFVDYFADDQLKKYCSEHKGNFFSVYEHICRIKE